MYPTRSLFHPGAFRPTMRLRSPVPNEEQAAHTVSQRLRRLRKIPVELLPLGAVVILALGAATYSSIRHFVVDKNIRLTRYNKAGKEAAARAAAGHDDHH